MEIDKINFSDLKSCDPEEVVLRTGCTFDKTGHQFFISVWGHKYCVDLKNFEVQPREPGRKSPHEYLSLFILYYLMKAKNIVPSGVWVSEKDIPGGAAFFRGPHTIPTDLITGRFGDKLGLFQKECESSGGVCLELADAAYTFQITPTIPVAVLYWLGDEDFPSEAKLLFDRTIEQHLPLDIIWALAVEICQSLGK